MSIWGVEGSWPASTKSRALCAGDVFGNGAPGSRTGKGGQRRDVVSSWGHRGPPWGPSEEPHEALPRTTCLAEGRKARGDITAPALLGGGACLSMWHRPELESIPVPWGPGRCPFPLSLPGGKESGLPKLPPGGHGIPCGWSLSGVSEGTL